MNRETVKAICDGGDIIANRERERIIAMTSESIDLLVGAMARDIIAKILPMNPTIGSTNDYEIACDRYNQVSAGVPVLIKLAKEIESLANDEYDAATANLRQYEERPGIPKKEYRTNLDTV